MGFTAIGTFESCSHLLYFGKARPPYCALRCMLTHGVFSLAMGVLKVAHINLTKGYDLLN